MKIKNRMTIAIAFWKKFSLKFTNDDIYTGKIMKCTSYYSKMEEAFKNGCTDYEGSDKKEITSDFVRNAILIKICYQGCNLYVELDKFDLKELKKRIKISPHGGADIFIEDDEFILLEEPLEAGMEFVERESVKKFEYKKGIPLGISSTQNEKVKTFVKKINKENKR
ncbi:MAG: hypothetical protein J6B98_05060 [Bacilli bacterium]|nr:hypothetical protein [Bacilli bacterium]